jgi:AcrR family transcriptional regulator
MLTLNFGEPESEPVERTDSRSLRTVQALLDQAEILFAERGVGQVSVREIVKQSGQRNASVALYHFGSREALIVAVIERRMKVLNALRNQYLDKLIAQGKSDDRRSLMEAAVKPMAYLIQTTEWGARYTQIVSEVRHRPLGSPEAQWDPAYQSAMDRIDELVRECLPDIPPQELKRRLRMIRGHVAYTLSGWIRQNGPVTADNSAEFSREVETLTDFMTGGVCAHYTRPSKLTTRSTKRRQT